MRKNSCFFCDFLVLMAKHFPDFSDKENFDLFYFIMTKTRLLDMKDEVSRLRDKFNVGGFCETAEQDESQTK